jgi:hypothetical protein
MKKNAARGGIYKKYYVTKVGYKVCNTKSSSIIKIQTFMIMWFIFNQEEKLDAITSAMRNYQKAIVYCLNEKCTYLSCIS